MSRTFLVTTYDLAAEGHGGAGKGLPFLHFATILRHHRGDQHIVGPPALVQDLMMGVAGTMGRLLGYRPSYLTEERQRARDHPRL